MDRERRVEEVVAEWCDRRDRGDAVPPEEVIAEHPELGDELRSFFATVRFVDVALSNEPGLPAGTRERIGEFRIVREIGRGGMGVVYEAEQVSMGRRVALKVLSPAVTGVGEAVERFQREARAAGKLHHTNIVPVYGMGEDRGQWFFAMELVEGPSLGELIAELRRGSSAPDDFGGGWSRPASISGIREAFLHLAEAAAGVADALHTAHQEGIVHRDVKPTNLLVTPDGKLRLVDFGLAHLEGVADQMTRTGQVLGTPHYMSPEQAMARRMQIDHRTDIYSLGATLYEALTLELPFQGDSVPELYSQIATEDPVLPRKIDPRIPRDLETVVLRAMEKDRDRRYQTAADLAADLRRFAEGAPVLARRVGPVGRAWRRVKRRKVLTALIASIVVLAAVGGVLALRARRVDEANRALEYASLCVRAGMETPRSMDLAAVSPYQEQRTPGETSRDIYTTAITLDPARHEAWFGRALAPGRTLPQRLADLHKARQRGLPERIALLAGAYLRRAAGVPDEAGEEELLADLGGGTPEEALFLARLLAGENRRDEARRLLTRAIESAEPGSILQYLALRYRASLRAKDGYFEEALADLHVLRSPAVGGDSIELRIEIAAIWRRMQHERQAEVEFRAAIEKARGSEDPAQWQRLCAKVRSIRENDWSRIATKEAVAAHPNSSGILLERALVAVEERLELCYRAIDLDPNDAVAWRILSRRLTGLGRMDEAMHAIQRACELDPGSAQIRNMLGLKLLHYERYADAVDAFQQAIARDPRFGNAHKYLGVAQERLGRFEEALESYARAIEVHPIHPMYHHRRWRLLRRLGRWEQARMEMEASAASNHAGPGGHHIRAFAFSGLEDWGAGLEDVEEAIRTHPRVDFLLNMRAGFLSDLGRFDEALLQYAEVFEHMGSRTDTHLGRAVTLLDLARYEEALGDLDAACELGHQNPLYPAAMRAFCLACLNRFEEASRGLDEPDELCPYAEYVLLWQARTLILLGKYGEALPRATTYAAWYPEHPCYRVRCLLALGEEEEAMAAARARLAWEADVRHPRCYAWLCAVAGDRERANRVLQDLGLPGSPTACYERAAVDARLRNIESALHWLERAIDGGFRRPAAAPPDPDFQGLEEDSRYLALESMLVGG